MSNKNVKYFSVCVATGDREHIGTICVNMSFSNELSEKVVLACEEHFDASIELENLLDVNDYILGRNGNVKLNFEDESISEEIFICESWLY
jgi:hypothetical protein